MVQQYALPGRRAGALLLLLYAALAIYLVPIFPHGASANELTRWATAASLVERGTFEISWTEPLVGPIVDTATIDTQTYSNKAPAVALLATPAYSAARAAVGPPDPANIRVSWTLMRWLTASVPLVFLGFWFWRQGASAFALSTLLFATPLFLYSLILFSHALAAVAVYFAYRLLFAGGRTPMAATSLAAGALAGLAVVSEFPAIVPVLVFGAGLVLSQAHATRERIIRVASFIAGGLPFAVGLLIYNAATFGAPFSFSYAHEASAEWAEVASHGLFGVSWPTPHNLWILWLSPARGMFFYSPVLALAAISLFRWGTGPESYRRKVRAAAVLIACVVLAGHGAPHGGWGAGARYLVLILPLLIEPLTDGRARTFTPLVAGLLLGWSFCMSVLPAITFPFAPPEFQFPHNTFWRPLLFEEGWITPTLGALLGLGHGWPALVPALLCLAAVPIVVWLAMGRQKHFLIGLGLAAILSAVYVLLPGLDETGESIRRASIAERFFRPAERLARFEQSATRMGDLSTLREVERLRWLIADTRGYAPDDWPYVRGAGLVEGPSARSRRVERVQQQGDLSGAAEILKTALAELPVARCEFGGNLGVIYYTLGRKDEALGALEAAQTSVRPGATPTCAACVVSARYAVSGDRPRRRRA